MFLQSQVFLFLLMFFNFFEGYSEHQFNAVQLIYFTCSCIAVDRHYIGLWVGMKQFTNHSLANDMVRQTAEWLQADDVINAMLDQRNHFCCQEPALAGYVA